MADISTNNPVDPEVLAALIQIQINSRESEKAVSAQMEPLSAIVPAIKEITDR